MLLGETDAHNMLWALLAIYQDKLALKYMGYYHRFLNKGLFIYALGNNNIDFMQESLRRQAFDKQMYREDMVVQTMLKFFQNDGSKTNFLLNVFHLTDISQWRPPFIEELLGIFEEKYLEGDQLLLSYNPLMSIALTCDLVVKIGQSRKMFRDVCDEQLETLLKLGEIYSSRIEEDEY